MLTLETGSVLIMTYCRPQSVCHSCTQRTRHRGQPLTKSCKSYWMRILQSVGLNDKHQSKHFFQGWHSPKSQKMKMKWHNLCYKLQWISTGSIPGIGVYSVCSTTPVPLPQIPNKSKQEVWHLWGEMWWHMCLWVTFWGTKQLCYVHHRMCKLTLWQRKNVRRKS